MTPQTFGATQPSPKRRPPSAADPNSHRFVVQADADPGTMARLLEEFCKRSIMPKSWHADVDPADPKRMTVQIKVENMTSEEARKMAAALRRHMDVDAVFSLDRDAPSAAPH